jgi:hypothetical protein
VGADLERAVAELVEVGGGVGEARPGTGGSAGRPSSAIAAGHHGDAAGAAELALDEEEQAGPIPVGVARVEERRPHAGLEREDSVADAERLPAARDPPALLVEALARGRPAVDR